MHVAINMKGVKVGAPCPEASLSKGVRGPHDLPGPARNRLKKRAAKGKRQGLDSRPHHSAGVHTYPPWDYQGGRLGGLDKQLKVLKEQEIGSVLKILTS